MQPGFIERQIALPVSMPEPERARLTRNAKNVLAYLREHGEATNVELCRPDVGGIRGVGRVWELQQASYDITKRHVHGGVWAYRLHEVAR